MSRARSGCWTCRLRTKKKCDEAKPNCTRCASLGIQCFGYGRRPSPEQLQGDRRALISAVGDAAQHGTSTFRVWRLKPGKPTSQQAPSQLRPRAGDIQAPAPAPAGPRGEHSRPQEPPISPVALDRINSDIFDFLHPQLLTNYTERVFWLDSRFYECPGPCPGNSWMKTFLVRSKETHLAAALMGLIWQAFQQDISCLININLTRSMSVLHSVVLQGAKDMITRSQSLVSDGDVLELGANLAKCASILLIFEVWRTSAGDWRTHMRGMRDILSWVVSRAPTSLRKAMKIRTGRSVADKLILVRLAPNPDMAMTFLALKWFVQSYTWNDIMSAVWVGPDYMASRQDDFYCPLLEREDLQMDKFMGCEDRVLFVLAKISMLEGKLADKIGPGEKEECLQEAGGLEDSLNIRLSELIGKRYSCPPGLERDMNYVTEMWIHAALVYLHIVTAGSRWNHPTLRRYVARGSHAYVNLPRRLDIHIGMPFGVLASMAAHEEAEELLALAEAPRAIHEINPGQRKTIKIVKECLKMRQHVEESSPSAGFDWRDAARSLDLFVLPA